MALQGRVGFLALAPPDLPNTQFDTDLRVSIRRVNFFLSQGLHQWICSCVGRKMSCTGVRGIVLTAEDKTITLVILHPSCQWEWRTGL